MVPALTKEGLELFWLQVVAKIGYAQQHPVTSVNGQTGEVVLDTIPSYSTDNNDQFLKIVNGSPVWATMQNAEEVSF